MFYDQEDDMEKDKFYIVRYQIAWKELFSTPKLPEIFKWANHSDAMTPNELLTTKIVEISMHGTIESVKITANQPRRAWRCELMSARKNILIY
jgi:hypothetical protein